MQYENMIIYTGNFNIESMNAAGKRVFANALILRDLGYHIVMVGVNSFDTESKDICSTKSKIDGIEVYHFPGELYNMHRSNYLLFYKQFEKLIVEKDWNIRAIIGYNSPTTAFFIGRVQKYCRNNGIKYITDVADWLIVDSDRPLFKIVRQLDITLKNAYYSNKSDGVIAISTWLERYYRKKVKNTIVIPPLAIERRIGEKRVSEVTQIIYAGIPFRKGAVMKNLSAMKDRFDIACEMLLYAKRKLVNFEFHVYGFTKDEIVYSVPGLLKIIDDLDSTIVFHGMVSMEEVQKAISNADYTILLREKNRMTMAGFPTKISESISCSTPVITTDTSDISKYLQEGKGAYYIDISDVEKSSATLEVLLKKSLEERIRQKKICTDISSFDRNLYCSKMMTFLENIISTN